MKALHKFLTLIALVAAPSMGLAQSAGGYPTKPARVIVPFPAGGPTDVLARLVASGLSEKLKQPFLIDNRPGGQTLIGIDAVAKSAADGYTLLVTATNLASEEVVNKEWPIRVERDLTVISLLAGSGYAVVVSNNIGVKSLRELVSYAKANPGKLNNAYGGSITPAVELLKYKIGLPPVENIMYKGGPLAAQAIVAGEVHLFGATVSDVLPLAKAGQLKIIAYTERTRHPLMPEVPTVNESGLGLTDFEANYWFAMLGPAGIPTDITNRLNSVVLEMQKSPAFLEKTLALGLSVYPLNAAESRNRIVAAIRSLEALAASGVKLR